MGRAVRRSLWMLGCVAALFVAALSATSAARAQEAWVQIEALPSLREAEERARAYTSVFSNVSGFAMTTGWYAVVLGPFTPQEAARQVSLLKSERLIPGDSYIATNSRFAHKFWPVGTSAVAPAAPPAPQAEPAEPDTLAAMSAPEVLPETPAEARRSEALLSREERMMLQEALQWDGFYAAAIDGDFGPGTRSSMANWQAAMGYDATGILTTAQRTALLSHYQAERAALGFQTYAEAEAGIEITLPMALVEFDRYEPPFVHFKAKDASGFRVLLISQQGEQVTLFGLYDIMQTLEIVPLTGERNLGRTSFELSGRNDRIQSYTFAELKGGLIKGFTLVWNPADAGRAERVIAAMKASFKPYGDQALSTGLGVPLAENRADLLAGLEVRRPLLSRSGFYIDASGTVATTDQVLAGCDRITLDETHAADVTLQSKELGLAILKPREALAPAAYAPLVSSVARIGSEIAVAGYSYEGALSEAVASFGTLADLQGLNGETTLARLAVRTLPGDAGGPVLDASGNLLGMLLPRQSADGRVLPEDVGFALKSEAMAAALAADQPAQAQTVAATTGPQGSKAAEDLAAFGRDITVLVSCWN